MLLQILFKYNISYFNALIFTRCQCGELSLYMLWSAVLPAGDRRQYNLTESEPEAGVCISPRSEPDCNSSGSDLSDIKVPIKAPGENAKKAC